MLAFFGGSMQRQMSFNALIYDWQRTFRIVLAVSRMELIGCEFQDQIDVCWEMILPKIAPATRPVTAQIIPKPASQFLATPEEHFLWRRVCGDDA